MSVVVKGGVRMKRVRKQGYMRSVRRSKATMAIHLDTDSGVETDTEEVVDDFEPLRSSRVVGPADIHTSLELCLRVVSEECEGGDDTLRGDIERQFILDHGVLLDVFW
jgi:hypothetical protein